MFFYDLDWLVVVIWIVDLYQTIPGCRGKEIATANSTLVVAQLFEIHRLLLRRYLSCKIKAEDLIFVSLYAMNFINVLGLEIINSYIAVPIATSNLLSIMWNFQSSNGLLNILILSQKYFVNIPVSNSINLLSLLVSIHRFCFEYFEILREHVFRVFNKHYFGHVLAICISKEAFLYLGSNLGGYGRIVDEVPKSDGAVRGASHKSG